MCIHVRKSIECVTDSERVCDSYFSKWVVGPKLQGLTVSVCPIGQALMYGHGSVYVSLLCVCVVS